MKNKIKKWILLCGLFGILAGVLGCSKPETPHEESKEEVETQEDGVYKIYTANKGGNRLSAYDFECSYSNVNLKVETLLSQLREEPKNADQNPAVPAGLNLLSYELKESVLYLYFDESYLEMKAVTEILCRAALAKTMTQLEQIRYISIYVGGQPLMDASGTPTGYVTGSDFIEKVSDVEDTAKVSTVTLYFANAKGTKLVAESRDVTITHQISLERAVVNALIEGPKEPGNHETLPSKLKVNSVQVKNNICYVNLSAEFRTDALNIGAHIPVYSLVNSLTGLSSISKVQIMIDGNASILFRDSISLARPLERKLDYIE